MAIFSLANYQVFTLRLFLLRVSGSPFDHGEQPYDSTPALISKENDNKLYKMFSNHNTHCRSTSNLQFDYYNVIKTAQLSTTLCIVRMHLSVQCYGLITMTGYVTHHTKDTM